GAAKTAAAETAAHRPPGWSSTAASATRAAIVLPLAVPLAIGIRCRAEAEGLRDVQVDQHHRRPDAEVARDDLLARQREGVEVAPRRMNDVRVAGLRKRRAVRKAQVVIQVNAGNDIEWSAGTDDQIRVQADVPFR